MTAPTLHYTFLATVPLDEVESTLLLALWGAESLHGEAKVRLGVGHYLDRGKRTCVLDATDAAGQDVNTLFAGYLARSFGPDAFRVERVRKRDRHAVAARRTKSPHARAR